MTRPAPFTKASLRRAIEIARETGTRLVVQRDGSMTFVRDDGRPHAEQEPLEREREIVL